MKTLAVVFCYQRAAMLRECAKSIFENTDRLPDEVCFIDDGSGEDVLRVLQEVFSKYSESTTVTFIQKPKNVGFSDSLRTAFAIARNVNPDALYLIESDYVFARGGLDAVADVLENTEQGRNCFGICGYDHPDFYRPTSPENYAREMVELVGEDNVRRDALWTPRVFDTGRKTYGGCFVSNTCISSFINWREAHVFGAYLDKVINDSRFGNCPDDGLLSAQLNLLWNRMAFGMKIDRTRNACWLNIRPSVANHISGGGLHAGCPEFWSDAGSPSWTGEV